MNTARVIQEEREVKRRHIFSSNDQFTVRYGIHVWTPGVDKLARQMPMPKGMRSKNKALGQGGSTRERKVTPKAANVLKIVPKTCPSTRKDSDLVDGRKFGKKIVSLRRKQGKRASQHIGKRFMEIAQRNVGRGQVFYLAAACGVLESR